MRLSGFILVLILFYVYCCLVVSSRDVCPSAICANLENVSFPFGAAPSCGASSTFVFSDCTTGQAHWSNFIEASPNGEVDTATGPPAVMDILYNGSDYGLINLTWGDNSVDVCTPAPSTDCPNYLPSAINLTAFADSAFQVSPHNIYLLFGCTNISSSPVQENSPICQSYQTQCNRTDPCFQLKPDKELMLEYVMNISACKQFQFFVTLNTSLPVTQWRAGMVQLSWSDLALPSSSGCNNVSCNTPFQIAAGVAASVVAMAILAVLALWCLRRRRKVSSRSVSSVSSHKIWTQRALSLSAKFGHVSTKEFSYEELLQATESFSDEKMIGDGGFGAVYVGFLKNGRKVAIKRLYHDNFRRMEQFYNEMKILSALQHPNLVKLYGFCCQDETDLLLVFEYASNGTVADQLHGVPKPGMPWRVRLNIAWETAEALSYLHNSMSPPIYHRDVKTTNILLDENFHAKLADFGLSRLVPLEVTHVSTAPQGTPGYVDPDYHQTYQLTDKSDVYSFGVVLMELVSAKLAVDMSRNRREINLSSLALMKISCGAWEELVDPCLEMSKNEAMERMVKGVVELAFQCLQEEKDDRPNMSVVAETLANLCRESGYGYEEIISPSSPTDQTIPMIIKPKSAYKHSSNSVDSSSVWTSSNTSSSSDRSSFHK